MKSYIKRLCAFRETHILALREAECILNLIKLDPDRGSEIASTTAQVAKRAEYIAINKQIEEGGAK